MQTAIALLFAVPLVLLTMILCWRRRAALSLADTFVVSFALFFGAYTIADVMFVPVDHLSAETVFATFFLIVVGCIAIHLFGRAAPAWVRSRTSLAAWYADLLACNGVLILFILASGVAFRIISAQVIGEFAVQNPELVEKAEAQLPYWFKAGSMLIPILVFTAGLACAAKAFASKGVGRLRWAAGSACGLWFFFGYGRRALLAYLFLVFWMYMRSRKAPGRILLLIVLSIPVLLAASNMFQQYRQYAHRGVLVDDIDLETIVSAASNFDLTASNLKEREAIWRFNASVIENDHGSVPYGYGTFLARSVNNFVPAVINPYKQIFDSELELERRFGIEEIDKAANVFVMTYGDFGIFSVVAAPALIIVFIIWAAAMLRTMRSAHLRALLLAWCFYYALNTEADYAAPIQIARDFMVLALLHWAIARPFALFRAHRRRRPGGSYLSPARQYGQ